MRNRVDMALRLTTAGLVVAGYAALAATPVYSGLVLIVPLLVLPLVPLGERLDTWYRGYRRVTTGIDVAFLFLLPVLFVWVGLYGAVVILVVYIQCRVLLHRKRERNYHYLFLMSFLLALPS